MKELNNEILLHPHDHKNVKDWKRILKFLDDNLDYSIIQNVIELGAGMGNIASHILKRNGQAKAICEDINPEYLKIAAERHPKIKTLLHDINQALPFPDAYFDLVTCTGTLHYSYVKNVETVLKEIARVSKKYILVDFHSAWSPFVFYEKLRYPKYHPRRFTPSQVRTMFRRLNLKEIAKIGTRTPFPKFFPYLGKIVIFLLKK